MSSFGTLSGRGGSVSLNEATTGLANITVLRIARWRVRPQLIEYAAWADSDTAGRIARAPGAKDGLFTTQGVYDFRLPALASYNLFQPGDKRTVHLWMDKTIANFYWRFPSALCLDFELIVDVDTERVVGWSAEWGADGIFYRPFES